MNAQLESGLTLSNVQPDCIKASFVDNKEANLVVAQDSRGQAFLFERFHRPAVFVEFIRTLPDRVRGNHVHQDCDEMLYVVSGEIEIYWLCEHGTHVFGQALKSGESVLTPKGTPHALRSVNESECIVLFDKDPRKDRTRAPILVFQTEE
jgi:mannose-6-phosphate isomerase-like protein (cupin superfamily)